MNQPHCRRFAGAITALAAAAALSSCSSTYDEKIADVRDTFYSGNVGAAEAIIRGRIAGEGEDGADINCLLLEESIVQLAGGKARGAEEDLLRVRDAFDRIEEERLKAFAGDFASYFLDDRSRPYSGEDYEKIFIRVLLAFADLLQGGDDVIAYANQVLEQQRRILDEEAPDRSGRKYKSNYRRIGVGAYLYGLVTEDRDPTAGSEVLISYRRVKDWEPEFKAIDQDIERADHGVHSPPGHGVLYVFAFVGRGPEKFEHEESDVAIATEITAQMTRFIPVIRERFGATLDLSPIRIPVLRPAAGNQIASVAVQAGGKFEGTTETLTDVTATALQQYEAARAWIIGKALVRRMVKKAITTAAKGAALMAAEKSHGSEGHGREVAPILIEIGGILANTLWSAMERADTRYWALLPDQIQVLRAELPVGEHDVILTPRLRGGAEGAPRSVGVEVRDAENTYVLAFIPTPGPGPAPQTTRPAAAPAAPAAIP